MPEKEIAFIHNAETEVKKKELFSKVRKGDVRILLGSTQKMDLDTQVAKLKLIKSSFMSRKYELEDMVIKQYPRDIEDFTERIKGFEGDIAITQKYPKKEDVFYPMTIDGLSYNDKEKAGTALLNMDKKDHGVQHLESLMNRRYLKRKL